MPTPPNQQHDGSTSTEEHVAGQESDMIDAEPTREYDAVWGDPQLFIRNVWYGLSLRARELGVSIV